MTGPYEYVAPNYWLLDRERGGAFGFNTETSPGPAIPPRESLELFIPKEHLWPIDSVWNFHAGGERFTTINVFTDGLDHGKRQMSCELVDHNDCLSATVSGFPTQHHSAQLPQWCCGLVRGVSPIRSSWQVHFWKRINQFGQWIR